MLLHVPYFKIGHFNKKFLNICLLLCFGDQVKKMLVITACTCFCVVRFRFLNSLFIRILLLFIVSSIPRRHIYIMFHCQSQHSSIKVSIVKIAFKAVNSLSTRWLYILIVRMVLFGLFTCVSLNVQTGPFFLSTKPHKFYWHSRASNASS